MMYIALWVIEDVAVLQNIRSMFDRKSRTHYDKSQLELRLIGANTYNILRGNANMQAAIVVSDTNIFSPYLNQVT